MNTIKRLFIALGVQAINSQTFANGYYYEYSLDNGEDGAYRVTRRLRNRYKAVEAESDQPVKVETPEQVEACKQALMYNFPHAFGIDGSVAIALPELPEPTPPETAAETETEAEAGEEATDA